MIGRSSRIRLEFLPLLLFVLVTGNDKYILPSIQIKYVNEKLCSIHSKVGSKYNVYNNSQMLSEQSRYSKLYRAILGYDWIL